MRWTNVDSEKILVEINEKCYEVEFERVTKLYYEYNYGADIDGNRGVPRIFIEDDYAEDIYVNGKRLEIYSDELQVKVKEEIEQFINMSDPNTDIPNTDMLEPDVNESR